MEKGIENRMFNPEAAGEQIGMVAKEMLKKVRDENFSPDAAKMAILEQVDAALNTIAAEKE